MRNQKLRIDRLFDALGDPTRRAIIEQLGSGPRSVSELARPLGITVTAVAQHLQILEQCGLAQTEKTGRVRTCRVDTAGLNVLEHWVAERRSRWERRFDRLGELLAESDED